MCRNICTLYNYDPPVSEAEIREAEIDKAQAGNAGRFGRR